MDFLEQAHQHGLVRDELTAAISARRKVDAAVLRSDKLCEMGCWLHGEGRRAWAGNHAFLSLHETHRTFHTIAAGIADQINREQFADAQRALRGGMPLAQALADLTASLRRMKAAASLAA